MHQSSENWIANGAAFWSARGAKRGQWLFDMQSTMEMGKSEESWGWERVGRKILGGHGTSRVQRMTEKD